MLYVSSHGSDRASKPITHDELRADSQVRRITEAEWGTQGRGQGPDSLEIIVPLPACFGHSPDRTLSVQRE